MQPMCERCWTFIDASIRVINFILRHDFGFIHMLWVYSGRRGVHCWVCDERARLLDPVTRSAIAQYLYLSVTSHHDHHRHSKPSTRFKHSVHPLFFFEVKDMLKSIFIDKLIKKYEIMNIEKHQDILFRHVGSKVKDIVLNDQEMEWEKLTSLERYYRVISESERDNRHIELDIIYHYLFPRLDINVTKQSNHLLKSPFIIHPETGNVCVPIYVPTNDNKKNNRFFDSISLDQFSLSRVPMVKRLNDQIAMQSNHQHVPIQEIYQKTDLKLYIDYFKCFIDSLLSRKTNHNEI